MDGVLNGYNFWSSLAWNIACKLGMSHVQRYVRDPFSIHEEKVKCLAKIVRRTNAKIVMSSSWRNGFWNISYEKKTTEQKLLTDMLNKYKIEVIDITPISDTRRRDEEIITWLMTKNERIVKKLHYYR